jgi:outer membrane lipoprotein-sorting protein
LRDLLELLYNAHRRFQTIHVIWSYRYDLAVMQLVQERYAAQEQDFSPLVSRSGSAENASILDIRHVLWWRKPDAWRLEDTMQGRTRTYSRTTDDFWTRSSDDGIVVHYNQDPVRHGYSKVEDLLYYAQLLSPAFLLASHDLQLIGETTFLGRRVLQVRAQYEQHKTSLYEDFFWATADEYRLLVDAEAGILLRYAAVVDGEEYAVTEVESVSFDQPINDDVFQIEA